MWLKETNKQERSALIAASAGWAVDAYDYMIFTFLIPTIMSLWVMTKADAGWIATGTLISSALGGWLGGILADKLGRVRILQVSVGWFAFFTFLCGFTQSPEQLFLTRVLQGLGFGAEWSVGSVLIAEMINARHRGKAVGLVQSSWAIGWAISAIAYWAVFALVDSTIAWRVLFWSGILPALLIVYVRRNLNEPEEFRATRRKVDEGKASGKFWEIFSRKYLFTTARASLLATGMQGGYYAVTTWLPTFLKTERKLSVLGTSSYLLVLIFGSFIGYLTSAWLSDKLGRRNCFMLFAFGAGGIAVIYTQIPITNQMMLFLGFPLGFFLSGIFSGMGAYLSELFPGHIRGSAQGFCYNFGRGVGSFCPALVGTMSAKINLGVSIGYVAGGAYLLVILMCLTLPETRGRNLADIT